MEDRLELKGKFVETIIINIDLNGYLIFSVTGEPEFAFKMHSLFIENQNLDEEEKKYLSTQIKAR